MRKSFRVLVTEKCNADCPTCFNKGHRKNIDMDKNDFFQLCDYLCKEGNIERIKIMGGEPTVHPDFEELIQYAQSKFKSVHIFTNAINNKICNVQLREKDSIIYNLSCLNKNFKKEKFLLDQKGKRLFEIQISSDSDTEAMKDILLKIKEVVPTDKMEMALTLNCIENIFEKREIIIRKWNIIKSFIKKHFGIDNQIDHGIPFCFFYGTNMKIDVTDTKCNVKCTGLINSSLELFHCNQVPKKLANVKRHNKFIPFSEIEDLLMQAYKKKINYNREKICNGCVLFNDKCNGGCFIHKGIIRKEDIDVISN